MFPLSPMHRQQEAGLLTTNAFRTRFASTKEAAICLYYETAGFAGDASSPILPFIFIVLPEFEFRCAFARSVTTPDADVS